MLLGNKSRFRQYKQLFLLIALVTIGCLVFQHFIGIEQAFNTYQEFEAKNQQRYKSLEARSNPSSRKNSFISSYINSHFTEIPEINIDVKFKHFQKLKKLREVALEKGILFRSEGDLVPAKIRHNNKTYKVKLRLKGDYLDHLRNPKSWSMRFHVKKGDALFGMRRFSLQAPHTKGYHYEALYLDYFRREGIIAPRYQFVNVKLNGENWGVMALEEHFSKELLESQKRREGAIIAFNENDFWQDRLRVEKQGLSALTHDFHNWRHAEIKIFREGKITKNPRLIKDANFAVSLMRGLANEEIKPSQAFDISLIGKFIAINELWGATHPLVWNNLRFYLNPLTRKLEPIAFDGDIHFFEGKDKLVWQNKVVFFAQYLLQDPQVFQSYKSHFKRLTQQNYLSELKEFFEEKEANYLQLLSLDHPNLPKLNFNTIIARTPLINKIQNINLWLKKADGSKIINDKKQRYHKAIYAYLIAGDKPYLQLVNPLFSETIVEEILIAGENIIQEQIKILPSLRQQAPSIKNIKLSKNYSNNQAVSGVAFLPNRGEKYLFSAKQNQPILSNLKTQNQLSEILKTHPYLKFEAGNFKISQGSYIIRKPLIIPRKIYDGEARYLSPQLIISEGVTLEFMAGSFIAAEGGLLAKATAKKPIKFYGYKADDWLGIKISGDNKSVINHAVIKEVNLNNTQNRWFLTGAVTAYKSDIEITNTKFEDIESEDALNLVNSKFSLHNLTFKNTSSDAIDSDFSTGIILNSTFQNIAGDGIDTSGSAVEINNISFNKIADKALSVGEKSTVLASNIKVNNASIAAVSKDSSRLNITNIEIKNIAKNGFMAYIKKPEYGAAFMKVSGLKQQNVNNLSLVQRKNSVIIDGVQMPTQKLDLKAIYGAK